MTHKHHTTHVGMGYCLDSFQLMATRICVGSMIVAYLLAVAPSKMARHLWWRHLGWWQAALVKPSTIGAAAANPSSIGKAFCNSYGYLGTWQAAQVATSMGTVSTEAYKVSKPSTVSTDSLSIYLLTCSRAYVTMLTVQCSSACQVSSCCGPCRNSTTKRIVFYSVVLFLHGGTFLHGGYNIWFPMSTVSTEAYTRYLSLVLFLQSHCLLTYV